MRVQRLEIGDVESWTVLGADDLPVAPVDRFLAHSTTVERSPQSVRSYAVDLRDLFEFLSVAKVGWTSARLEDFGRFVGWLRGPERRETRALGGGGVGVRRRR